MPVLSKARLTDRVFAIASIPKVWTVPVRFLPTFLVNWLPPAPTATLPVANALKTISMIFEKVSASLQDARQAFKVEQSPRREELERLAAWFKKKVAAKEPLRLVVICTHNSRRSHLGQFWSSVAARSLGIPFEAFSGGTEATTCHPNTLAALERAGARVEKLTGGNNPHYRIAFGTQDEEAIEAWSKVYSDEANPKEGFAAIMVCSDADQGCPWVEGAEARFSLPYLDPKHEDGTGNEAGAYDTASKTIAGEMAWLVAHAEKEARS